jgi:UDP-GlcNAc:undecaprenyl-phosphate GlcNAc-1-phosphate transferase
MGYKDIFFYSLFFVVSMVFSLLINGLFFRFSKNMGMRNLKQDVIRWESQTKPAFGGIYFYIVFLLSISAYSILSGSKILFQNLGFIGILASASIAFLVGLADDAYNTKPLLKLLAQFVCGLILVATGTYIQLSSIQIINYAVTIIWVIGIMNSINMLDNMDAITSIVSIFIFLSGLVVFVLIHSTDSVYFIILLGCIASLLGFLFFNWHPSKIYMGDTGSQFLGLLLAAIGIMCFWNTPFDVEGKSIIKQIVLTSVVFILPLSDTISVIINRMLKKKSPFIGGRDHTTHHLSYMGLSETEVAFVFLFLSSISALFCYAIASKCSTNVTLILSLMFSLLVFFSLFIVTKIKRK